MKLYKLTNSVNEQESKLTIVFIHGNSMNSIFFENQFDSNVLSQFNLVSIDLPGHGKSEKLKNYSIPNLIRIISENLKDFNEIVLIGHSLGGHLSIQLLPFLKTKCKGLFLLDCPPLKLPLNVKEAYVLNEVSENFLKKDVDDKVIKKMVKLIYSHDGDVGKEIIDSFRETDGQFREDFAISLMEEDIQDEVEILNLFKGKITFAFGSDDAVVNHDYIVNLNSKLNNSELYIINNCGHCPQIESPKKLNDLIVNFIDDLKK